MNLQSSHTKYSILHGINTFIRILYCIYILYIDSVRYTCYTFMCVKYVSRSDTRAENLISRACSNLMSTLTPTLF